MFQRAVLRQPSAESATAQVSVFSRANTDGFFTSAHKLWLTISAAINDVMMISRVATISCKGRHRRHGFTMSCPMAAHPVTICSMGWAVLVAASRDGDWSEGIRTNGVQPLLLEFLAL